MGRFGIAVAMVVAPSVTLAGAATALLVAGSSSVPRVGEVGGSSTARNVGEPSASAPCAAPDPVLVFTEDVSSTHHDLCAAFHRVLARVSLAEIPPGRAAWHFRLDSIVHREIDLVDCGLRVEMSTQAGVFGVANGAATVRFRPTEHGRILATNDCVEALIEDLIANKLVKPTVAALEEASLP
jgi:hypothetical protein